VRCVSLASLAVLAAAAGCRSLGAPGSAGPAPDAPLAVGAIGGPRSRVSTRLANGVTVVVEENHAAPVVAIQVWVAGGASADPPAQAGAAHLYEHLVFAGTRRRPAGTAPREIEAVGGRLGAWTGLDETVFHATVASPFFDLGVDVLGDALSAPAFPPAAVEQAKREAVAELARQASDPAQQATDMVRAALFAGGAHARPLLGTPATVQAFTPQSLAARFAESHVGGAMTVVVVGDVTAAAARASVARAFAAVPAGSAPPAPDPGGRGTIAPAAAVAASASSPDGALALGIRAVPADPAQAAALDLLGAVLARGDEARLPRELIDNRQVATAVHALTFRSRAGAMLELVVSPGPQRSETAAGALVEETLRLAREEVPPDELAAARALLLADLARGEEGVDGRARRLGWARALLDGDDAGERYRARLERIDGPALRDAAQKFLRPGSLALAVVEPARAADPTRPRAGDPARARGALEAEAGHLQAMLSAATAPAAAATGPAPAAPAGDLVRVTTAAGVRVVVLRDPGAPSVAVEAAWAGGGRAEERASNGAAALIAVMLDRGTRARSATQIAADVRALGGSMSGIADRHHLGLRAEWLPATWRRGLATMADSLLRPSFPASELDGGRRVVIDRARAGDGDPARAAWKLFREAVWPDQPFRLEPAGTPASLAGLTRMRLLDHYRRHYPLDRLVVAVVGDVEPREVAAAAGALFAWTQPGPRPVASPPPATPGEPARHEPVTVFGKTDRDVAEIILGYPGPPPGDPDRPALEILAEVLRARAARGDAGAAPVPVGAVASRGLDPGFVALSARCAPAVVDATVAHLRSVVAAVVAGGVTDDETSRVARRLAGERALELRSRAAIADALMLDEAFGLPPLTYRAAPDRLSRVTAADVARVARRVFDPQREAIAVVRPEERPPRAQAAGAAPAQAQARLTELR
jgi:zinc protease